MVGVAGRNKAGYEADLSGTKYVYLGLTASQSYQIFVRKVSDDDAVHALAEGTAFDYKDETYTVRIVSRTLHHQKTTAKHAGILKSVLQELRQEVEKLLDANDDKLQHFRFKPTTVIVESSDDEEDAQGAASQQRPAEQVKDQPRASVFTEWLNHKQKQEDERYKNYRLNQGGNQNNAHRQIGGLSTSPLVSNLGGGGQSPNYNQQGNQGQGNNSATYYGSSAVDPKIVKPPILAEDKSTKRDDVVDIRLFNVDLDSYAAEAREYYEILRQSVPPTSLLYNLRTNIKVPSLVKAIRGKQYSNVEEYLSTLEKAIFPGQNSRKFADWITFTSFETKPETLVNDLTEYERVKEKVEKIPATEIAGLNLLRSLHKEVEPHQLSAILTRVGGKFDYDNVGDGIRTILADKIVPSNIQLRGDTLYYADVDRRYPYRPGNRTPPRGDRGRNNRESNRDQHRGDRHGGSAGGYRGGSRTYDRTTSRGDSGKRNDQYSGPGPSRTYSRDDRGGGYERPRRHNNEYKGDRRSFSQGSRSQNASRSASNSRPGSASRHTSTERVEM